MIFYGPSGVGKTTVARIIAENAGMTLHKLNGTSASTADIKEVVGDSQSLFGTNGVLLYLDEIQYLNKKQQQSLLEYIEDGSITLISSTTENPYFYVYNAIISRSTVFEFKPVTPDECLPAIRRAFGDQAREGRLRAYRARVRRRCEKIRQYCRALRDERRKRRHGADCAALRR